MANTFLAVPLGTETPDMAEFKILPEVQKRLAQAEADAEWLRGTHDKLRSMALEIGRVHKNALAARADLLSKGRVDEAKQIEEFIRGTKNAYHTHAEPGVVAPSGAVPLGFPRIIACLEKELIPRAEQQVGWLRQKYQVAAAIVHNPANRKFVPQMPGHAFTEQGTYVKDSSTMTFDADGIYWIPDGKGGRRPYLYKDPRNPGARPRFHPSVTGGPVRRFLRRWLGL